MSENNHTIELSDKEIENIVRRSYQYVAMFNVNNKFALTQGGWNTVKADTVDIPAFDSKYVSFMVTAYDHYVTIPMASRMGDFKKPEKVLFYSARTDGYQGEPVKGVDRIFETNGDFVSAVFRVMPHANEPERFKRVVAQMQSVKLVTLSEFQGKAPKPVDELQFPQVGKTDADVFANNFLEVMQFVFNHVSLDPADELDQAVMAALKPLGVEPGKSYDPSQVAKLDGSRFREFVEKIIPGEVAKVTDPEWAAQNGVGLFQPKGKITLERLVVQSIIGPIGQPAFEAVYPAISTTDGVPMNAMHNYVLRMKNDEMPPAMAFWSATLYDTEHGFFIPNDRKKYSVGENGGMKLDADGGIAIYIAAEQPEGVPEENWLPVNRGDYGIDVIMRLYAPDLQRYQNWSAPKAEKIS